MSHSSSPIITTSDLQDVITAFSTKPFIAVDTEFMRETTYYPKLCLVQLSDGENAVCIDPLSEQLDLSPLFDLMRNHNVMKVFHAGKQDMEIFVHLMGDAPAPVYDTQLAGMVCGLGEQAGYDRLVSHFTGITLDKSSRFTNWAQRPLSERQLSYALDDVVHLAAIYPQIESQIRQKNRTHWLDDELTEFGRAEQYITDPMMMWKRLKLRSRKPAMVNRLRHLAAWRETTAQAQNMPRGHILRDDTLLDLAGSNPSSLGELKKIRGFPKTLPPSLSEPVLKVLKDAADIPADRMPELPTARGHERPPAAVSELLRVLLKHVCDEAEVAPRLIATSDDLDRLATGNHDGLACLQGWRGELFGTQALELMAGRLALSLSDASLKISDVRDS